MSTPKKTYTVNRPGAVPFTRKSGRTYTHAIVYSAPAGISRFGCRLSLAVNVVDALRNGEGPAQRLAARMRKGKGDFRRGMVVQVVAFDENHTATVA